MLSIYGHNRVRLEMCTATFQNINLVGFISRAVLTLRTTAPGLLAVMNNTTAGVKKKKCSHLSLMTHTHDSKKHAVKTEELQMFLYLNLKKICLTHRSRFLCRLSARRLLLLMDPPPPQCSCRQRWTSNNGACTQTVYSRISTARRSITWPSENWQTRMYANCTTNE